MLHREHIHRKHIGHFCPDCWNMFNDADSVYAHLRRDTCEKKERIDYSEGICTDQAQKLKSRKGILKMTEEEHWKHVFCIVFPDYQGNIPPSSCKSIADLILPTHLDHSSRLHYLGKH